MAPRPSCERKGFVIHNKLNKTAVCQYFKNEIA